MQRKVRHHNLFYGNAAAKGMAMTSSRISATGKYLAQCEKCGTSVEVHPEIFRAELFFEVLQATFYCCGRQQVATFTKEKDTVDFH
ncbi:MAG: hypothetical protein L6277_04990 [Desulfobacterales bacterium]|nr:hypothetical protein [Pseudomonadota bacterium]MCG2771428.1 hypothetical protein [Desulfobacterales bacterium]